MDIAIKTGIVVNDLHYPFQDEKAIVKVLGLAAEMQPDYFIVNGDLVDMHKISPFDNDPLRIANINEEFILARIFLEKVAKALPNAEKHFIFGNHEYRFDKYIWKNAKELAGLDGLSVAEQLRLKEYGFAVHYRRQKESYMDLGPFLVGHFSAVSQHSGYTAKKLLDYHGKSLIQGHVHRGGVHYRTINGKVLMAVENFCLCNLTPEYLINPNWQHGFTLFRIGKNYYDIEPVPIKNYKCRYF